MQTTLFTSYNDTRTITIYLMKYCGMKQNKNDKYIFSFIVCSVFGIHEHFTHFRL